MKNSDFSLVSILPYFHAAVRCVALFYTLPKPRNRGLGRCGLTWPQMQQESTPSFRRGLPACCSCRTAVGDTNCCRTNLPFSHGRRVSRHCRNPCVHRAECSYVLCALPKSQAMTLRLGCRQFHGYFSISFPITSFPSVCRSGLKLAVVVQREQVHSLRLSQRFLLAIHASFCLRRASMILLMFASSLGSYLDIARRFMSSIVSAVAVSMKELLLFLR